MRRFRIDTGEELPDDGPKPPQRERDAGDDEREADLRRRVREAMPMPGDEEAQR